ncbi:MAG: hypothetical protein KBD01_03220 [Acidobacteria bacterium]|nr:hypothetical protein [Acidobacteriota bacterium]
MALALAAAVAAALAAGDTPVVRHDCSLVLATRPRPCDGNIDVTRRTSIYFELVLPRAGNYPSNGINLNSVVLKLKPEGQPQFSVFGPNQAWGSGWSGQVLPSYTDGDDWVFGFECIPNGPLLASTRYTATVEAQTKQGAPVDPATKTWTFTTRRHLPGSGVTFDVDLAGPTVDWVGRWFGGTAKVTFDTSAMNSLEAVYALMDEVHARAPEFLLHHRDTPWTGDYYRNSLWDGSPNIYRERETRRITGFENVGGSTRLSLADIVERELYGIPAGRPLSADYVVGERVLVCDADQSEVREIVAINDAASTLDVTQLVAPLAEWVPGDPADGPADNPDTPGNFTYPLAAVRKYAQRGTPVYYWDRVHDEIDRHVAHGRKPIVRINDVPVDLCESGLPANAQGGECQNKPKNWLSWDAFVHAVVSHLIERYGPDVATWYFVIGNENTLSPYWKTRFNEFFDYWDVTSNAMLRAFEDHGLSSSSVLVGGVEDSPAGNRFLEEVAYHCAPDADNPSPGYDETNLVCTDAAFGGLRSARVAALCAAHADRGCPFDYYSIHTYRHALEAHDLVQWSWDRIQEIPSTFFEPFRVNNWESGPSWVPLKDPAAINVFAASGFFSTWGADYFQRVLADAMADPRRAAGEVVITTWGFNDNFAGGTQSVASVMRIDDDQDGTQDGVAGVGNYYFRMAELAARMSHEVADLGAVADAGARIGGWRSVEPHGDKVLLYAHDRIDPDHRETQGWTVTLNLSRSRFAEVDVTEYRLDRDHGTRAAYDALPKRGGRGMYTRAELADLLAADRVAPVGPPVRYAAAGGALTLTTFVQGQGVTFLEIAEVDPDGDGFYGEDDNCPGLGNPDQADGDADGAGDACDCAPADAGSVALPAEVTRLVVGGGAVADLAWDDLAAAAGSGTLYDVPAGSVAELLGGGGFGSATCLVAGLAAPTFADAGLPAPGDAKWYVPLGRNACGTGTSGRAELDAGAPCP